MSIVKIQNWYWPLPFEESENLNDYLDTKIGVNDKFTKKQRLDFVENLYKSLSLDSLKKHITTI